jgi:hypothetical protein
MTKATAHLTPRRVLGNRLKAGRLSIEEASAALVAMLGGAKAIPPRRQLRTIATTVLCRQAKAVLAGLHRREVRHG